MKKCIFVLFAPALEEKFMEAFKKSGLTKYSLIPHLLGVGSHSEPHLDTQVWPGSNEAMLIITDEEAKKNALLKEIAVIKKDFSEEGIKAFVWEVLEEV